MDSGCQRLVSVGSSVVTNVSVTLIGDLDKRGLCMDEDRKCLSYLCTFLSIWCKPKTALKKQNKVLLKNKAPQYPNKTRNQGNHHVMGDIHHYTLLSAFL